MPLPSLCGPHRKGSGLLWGQQHRAVRRLRLLYMSHTENSRIGTREGVPADNIRRKMLGSTMTAPLLSMLVFPAPYPSDGPNRGGPGVVPGANRVTDSPAPVVWDEVRYHSKHT